MNNAVYSKTMENVRNRIDERFESNKNNHLKRISKPNYVLQKIFDNNFVAVRKRKVTLKLNKPKYVGMSKFE